jgi:hypothetical protein
MKSERGGGIDICRHPQLIWIEWHSEYICAIDLPFETKIDLPVKVLSSHGSRIPLEAL